MAHEQHQRKGVGLNTMIWLAIYFGIGLVLAVLAFLMYLADAAVEAAVKALPKASGAAA